MTEHANPISELLSLISSQWPECDPLEEIADPKWPTQGRTWGDWKQYVQDDLRRLWPSLSLEARLCCYLTARHSASHEYSVD
jgi:hypothetical protein